MENLSEHISYQESIRSRTALKYGINNHPNEIQFRIMQYLAVEFFEPLRATWGVPLHISSFYRSKELNRRIGGARASDHMVLGDTAAIDIDQDPYPQYGVTNNEIFYEILDNHKYYKLIAEFPKNGKLSWVHISYSTDEDKNSQKNTYIAHRPNGRTKYVNYFDYKHLIY